MLAPLFVLLVGTTETNRGFWWDFAILFASLLVAVTGLLIVVLAILFAMIRNPSDDAQVAAPDQITLTTPEAGIVAPTTSDAKSETPQAATVAKTAPSEPTAANSLDLGTDRKGRICEERSMMPESRTSV